MAHEVIVTSCFVTMLTSSLLDPPVDDSENARVCSEHFEPTAFANTLKQQLIGTDVSK